MLSNDAERRVRERILVVDDELLIRNVIATRLQWRGYNVTLATNGEEAVVSFQREPMDLVVLDLMVPRFNGFGVLRAVRSSSDVPVLMLSACDRLEDRILGLELAADDYLVKPFSLAELEARIRCLLRRARLSTPNPSCRGSVTRPTETQISGLTLYYGTRQVFRGIKRIKLTSMEFSLLELLVSQAGQPVPRLKIMETIWGYVPERHADTRVVDVHVARLRLKLEQDPKHPELILTARSLGYLFQRLPELSA
jgi:OmpR family response regulator RpaB